QQRIRVLREFLQFRAEEGEVDVPAGAAEVEGGDVADGDAELEPREAAAHFLHDRALGPMVLERLPWAEADELTEESREGEAPLLEGRERDVRASGVDAAEKSAARRGEHGGDTGDRADLLLDEEHRLVHRLDARSLGRGHAHLELAFIDIRRDV